MPLASNPRLSGTLSLAVALTAIAGFADTHVFLNVTRVFVANMSGNLVLLGIAIGETRWTATARFVVAILAFIAGIAAASRVHDRRRRSGRRVRPDLVLVVEAVLLLFVTVWVAAIGPDVDVGARVIVFPALVAGAFAMGMQNAALLRVGAVAVATTYASGSVARLGSERTLAFGAAHPEEAAPHRRAARVLGTMIVAYVAGAAIAAWVGRAPAWLLVPVGGLLVVALVTYRRSDRPELDEDSEAEAEGL